MIKQSSLPSSPLPNIPSSMSVQLFVCLILCAMIYMQNHHWILQTLNYQRRPFLNKSGKYLNVCVRIISSRCIWLHVFEVTVSTAGWWMIASYFISASQLLVSLLYIAVFISLFKFKVLYQLIFIQYCVSYIDMLRTGQSGYAWRCNTCTYAFTCILSH